MKESTKADIEYFKGLSFSKLLDMFSYYDNISVYFKSNTEGSFVMKSKEREKFYIIIKETENEKHKKRALIYLYAYILEDILVSNESYKDAESMERRNKFVEEFNALYNK